MPRKARNIRPIYAQIPAALAAKVERAMADERRVKREIIILALEAYLLKPGAEAPAPVATPVAESA